MNINHTGRHGADFLLLVVILGLGLGGILLFSNSKFLQTLCVILMCVFYVFWGIYHHHHDRNLTIKIVLEYTAIATLVATLLSMFLLRV